MRTLRRMAHRFLGFFTGASREHDLAVELQSHIDMQTEDNLRMGMPREQARRAAALKLGGVETTKESYRDQRSLPQLETLGMDLRFAAKSFSRRPGLVTVAVLSLGLGIGATTTIFTWFKAVYLDPLPGVRDARHLVTINAEYKDRCCGMSESYAHFQYIRDHSPAFSGLFAHEMQSLALSDGKLADMTVGGIVSGNYFQVLGVDMALGRAFRPEEDEAPDRDAVIVLGYDLWQQRFGGDPTVLGRRVELNRVPFTVIGVAPPGFVGVYGGIRQDYWFPMHMYQALELQAHRFGGQRFVDANHGTPAARRFAARDSSEPGCAVRANSRASRKPEERLPCRRLSLARSSARLSLRRVYNRGSTGRGRGNHVVSGLAERGQSADRRRQRPGPGNGGSRFFGRRAAADPAPASH